MARRDTTAPLIARRLQRCVLAESTWVITASQIHGPRNGFPSSSASQSGLGEPRPGLYDIPESQARRYLVSQAYQLVTTLQGVFGRRHLPQPPSGFLCCAAGAVSSGSSRFQLGFDLSEILGLGLEVGFWRRATDALTETDVPAL
jgi:hypothetical protein